MSRRIAFAIAFGILALIIGGMLVTNFDPTVAHIMLRLLVSAAFTGIGLVVAIAIASRRAKRDVREALAHPERLAIGMTHRAVNPTRRTPFNG